MNYTELRRLIKDKIDKTFEEASIELQEIIFGINTNDTIGIITEIGIIPEDIIHDSTEEKLYTKVSDILFAKALKEMNFEVQVLRERSDCADIVAQSKYHEYSLVGDAKAFRLSRTAKNAKDFKVDSMVHWRGYSNFSVLICPYYQYPKATSQIYKSALDGNVALFSWEYLYVLLSSKVRETPNLNLSDLWNQSAIISRNVTVEESKKSFIRQQDENILNIINISKNDFNQLFVDINKKMVKRGNNEIRYFQNEINRIRRLDRKSAIEELLVCKKLDSKIGTIKTFINQLNCDD
ncbi:MAG: HindIII family type II restriction endonuclease [Bacteroidales bacterium]|nr:HindIII family type II restriction endonuclease [Bacteroidales bacterium]